MQAYMGKGGPFSLMTSTARLHTRQRESRREAQFATDHHSNNRQSRDRVSIGWRG